MIFIILGTQKFQFNRLLKYVDELVEEGVINETIIAQTGYSDYNPKNFQCRKFMDREEFLETVDNCKLVITHGGTGAIITALKKCRKVIAMPRLRIHGEHIDDHQIQLLQEFDENGLIKTANDKESLRKLIQIIDEVDFKPYVSNTDKIIALIEEFITTV